MSLPIELVQAMKQMELKDCIPFLFANQCAPVVFDYKPADLIMVRQEEMNSYKKEIEKVNKEFYVLYTGSKKNAVLVYNKNAIYKVIQKPSIRQYLEKRNDAPYDIELLLKKIGEKIENFYHVGTEYPHELGLLLGYPLGDVLGYINNHGMNYLYCGYWKVYEDVDYAKKKFYQYDLARAKMMIQLFGFPDCIDTIPNV